MKRSGIGVALFIIIILTVALVSVMYFAHQWFGAVFLPVDLLAWLEQLDLAMLSTLSEGLMDILTSIGLSVPVAEQTTTLILATITFGSVALLIGLGFYIFSGRRGRKPDWIDGLTVSVILAAFMIFVNLVAGSSRLPAPINITWLILLSLGWGIGLSYALAGTMRPVPSKSPAIEETMGLTNDIAAEAGEIAGEASVIAGGDQPPPEESVSLVEAPNVMDRRQFLLRFGAGTAAIAAASATAGSALAYQAAADEQPRLPIPMASIEFRQAQRELLGTFRRFVILHTPDDVAAEANVLALGTEYPDRDYVSIWIGERSPIMIYESIETALTAFGSNGEPASVYWLDGE
jgi:hypothetical protein